MRAYIINLDERHDRWQALEPLCQALDFFQFSRVPAVSFSSPAFNSSKFATPGVTATWASHQKVFQTFLSTNDDFALVFEDDFEFKLRDMKRIRKLSKVDDFDFLQLGFLKVSFLSRIGILYANLFDYCLKLLITTTSNVLFSHSKLVRKTILVERRKVSRHLVMNDIREGGHAYLVSRRFAEAMLEVNSPTFLSTDGLFMAISWMRTFRMARTRKSLFSQSNSPSSVTKRVLLEHR